MSESLPISIRDNRYHHKVEISKNDILKFKLLLKQRYATDIVINFNMFLKNILWTVNF